MKRLSILIVLSLASTGSAAQLLKQSTAAEVACGPFVDSADGVTAETTLTISQADVRLKKVDGDWAQKNESTAAAHEESGYYRVLLDTTDTNTLGRLRLAVSESGALPVWQDFMVVPANTFDSLVSGSDALAVDATEISGDSAAADNVEDAFDESGASGVALALESLGVINSGGTAVAFVSSGSNGHALQLVGNGNGEGINLTPGATGNGFQISATAGDGVIITTGNGDGIDVSGGTAGEGILVTGGATGNALQVVGGGTSGDGVLITATSGDGIDASGGGAFSGMRLARGNSSGDDLTFVNDDAEINADVAKWLGTAALTPTVAGVPEVDVTHVAGGLASVASQVDSNVVQISGDTTAADNAELMFDGTGYAGGTTKLGTDIVQANGTNIMTPTAGLMAVNAYQISDDTTAAVNLEAALDGTGFNVGAGSIVTASTGSVTSSVTVGTMAAAALDQFVLTDTGETSGTVVAGSVADLSQGAASASAVADAVWDEARSGHTTAGTFGHWTTTDSSNQLTNTTVATVNSQTSFDLTAGYQDDDVYNDMQIVFRDVSNSNAPSVRYVTDYDFATQTVTINSAPEFTVVAGDTVDIYRTPKQMDAAISSRLAPTVANRTLDITAGGAAGIDWANVESPTTTLDLANTSVTSTGDVLTIEGVDATNAIDARLAAQTGSNFTAIPELDKLDTALELDGSVYRLTTNALEQAPSGSQTNPQVLVSTTIAAVTSQTVFTLTSASSLDDSYTNQTIVLYDASASDYPSVRTVSNYVGATKTVTLNDAPDFTIVAGDGVKVFTGATMGSGTTLSPHTIGDNRTWKFSNRQQVTSPNIIVETTSFDGELAFDFTQSLNPGQTINSVDSTTVTAVDVSDDEPTIVTTAIAPDRRFAHISIDCSSAEAGDFIIEVQITTTDSQVITRRGRLRLQ
jgi:hypothetical protein